MHSSPSLPYHSYLINGGMFRMYQIPAPLIVKKINAGIKLTFNGNLKKNQMADERRGRPAFSSKEYTRNSTKGSTSDSFQSTRQPYPAGKAMIWIALLLIPIFLGLISIWLIWELFSNFLNWWSGSWCYSQGIGLSIEAQSNRMALTRLGVFPCRTILVNACRHAQSH